jgi:phosphate:Na+ symporter
MYLGGVDLSFPTAAFLILGANIGTCSTALLSSLAAGTESKRAALIHVTYKLIAGTSFAVIILVFPGILIWFQNTWQDSSMQVAMFNTLYNLVAAGVMIFFTKQLVAFVHIILPKKQKESTSRQLMHIVENKDQKPETIFAQSHSEICRMGQIALNNLHLALEAFFERNYEKAAKVMEVEKTIDYLRTEITAYLTRVKSATLTTEDIEKIGAFLFIAYDIERLGDHAENIAEYAVGEDSHKDNMSDEALSDLDTVSNAMIDSVTLALKSFENLDGSSLALVDELEQRVDDLCKKTLDRHVARLNAKKCDPRSSVVFANMISDLERCSDHAVNIAARVRI